MKLLLVLLVLACRELVVAEWRDLLTKPARYWRDSMITAFGKQLSSGMLLSLIAAVPALLITLLLWLTQETSSFWQYLLACVVLAPVFSDRHLPSVLIHYRQQWLEQDTLATPKESLLHARRQLLTSYLQELISPLFWVFLLGVWGVVVVSVYYSMRICARLPHNPVIAEQAERAINWLDWLPSRVLALSFALAGRFVETWVYWQANIRNNQLSAVDFIDAAASEAEYVEHYPPESIGLIAVLAAYESLCYRSVMIWLILLTLHVLF